MINISELEYQEYIEGQQGRLNRRTESPWTAILQERSKERNRVRADMANKKENR